MSEELKEKLKEMLLVDFYNSVAKGDEKLVDGFTRDKNLLPVLTPKGKAFIDQLLELFEEFAKEVIGEDELHTDWCAAEKGKGVICICGVVIKNELRAEQRKKTGEL